MAQHLGLQVSAYVDRSLEPAVLLAFDRHLVACEVCRHAADQERRLLASLRHGTPGVPSSLQASLLSLAAHPPVPQAPPAVRAAVPTVAPAAPPLHRSPRRAAALAGFAATASAVAAIGLATAGPGVAPATPLRPAGARSGTASLTLPGGSTQLLTQVTPPSLVTSTATAVPAALRAPVATPRTPSVTLPEPATTTRSELSGR